MAKISFLKVLEIFRVDQLVDFKIPALYNSNLFKINIFWVFILPGEKVSAAQSILESFMSARTKLSSNATFGWNLYTLSYDVYGLVIGANIEVRVYIKLGSFLTFKTF